MYTEHIKELKQAAIAFSSDMKMEYPLHVAASSVLRTLSPEWEPHFYLALSGFSTRMVDQLRRSLDLVARPYKIILLPEIQQSRYKGFKPLHGNLMIYNRLLLPDMVSVDRLLYLDTDTLTNIDVSSLFTADMNGFAAGFVFEETVAKCGEATIYRKVGMPENGAVFNSGVVLFNIPQWKKEERTPELLEFCKRGYRNGDQTALNYVFHGHAYRIPIEFNVMLYPQAIRDVPDEGIYHFAGSPKPWDLAGGLLNRYSSLYRQGVAATALPEFARSEYLRTGSYERALRLVRSYYRITRLMLKNRATPVKSEYKHGADLS